MEPIAILTGRNPMFTDAEDAADGPLFVIMAFEVTLAPGAGGLGEREIAMAKSVGFTGMVTSALVLPLEFGWSAETLSALSNAPGAFRVTV